MPIHLHVVCQQVFISTHQQILRQRVFGEHCISVYHIIYPHVLASEVLFTHVTQICLYVFIIKVLSMFGDITQLIECSPTMHKTLGAIARVI